MISSGFYEDPVSLTSEIGDYNCEMLFIIITIFIGMRNRSIGTHNMNEYSSRSHSILTVNITSEQAVSIYDTL